MAGQPTYPIVTRTARVDLLGNLTGGANFIDAMSSMYVQAPVTEAFDSTALGELAAQTGTWWDTNIKPITSHQAELQAVRATYLGDTLGNSIEVSFNTFGTVVSDLALTVGAPVVRFLGDGSSYPTKAEIRPWGMAETQSAGNALTTAYMTAMLTAWTSWITFAEAFDASTWDPGLTAQPVIISVFEPKATGGGTPATRYRPVGLTSTVAFVQIRKLVGRAVSRQT